MHIEQFGAVQQALGAGTKVVGIEIFSYNEEYPFGSWRGDSFLHVNLFSGEDRAKIGMWRVATRIVRQCLAHRARTVFMSKYERPYILVASLILRLLGRRVFVMNDSKFDDYPRFLWREIGKRVFYSPYQGAIVASPRSADYLRFLGVNPEKILLHCYTTSLERVRADAAMPPAPDGTPHDERNFLCVARLVSKKNHPVLLAAYARYVAQAKAPRRLILCGSGPLEADIQAQIAELGLTGLVELRGNLGAAEVARELARGLCLLLPSIEEQYGIVVIEAQAMGLPIILTDACGARDLQVRSGVNGFVVEPANAAGMAYFMHRLAEDEPLWTSMARAALSSAETGDTSRFVGSALRLIGAPRAKAIVAAGASLLYLPPSGGPSANSSTPSPPPNAPTTSPTPAMVPSNRETL
jgi:glycosyltransferase involved in cell wall biosynthesis